MKDRQSGDTEAWLIFKEPITKGTVFRYTSKLHYEKRVEGMSSVLRSFKVHCALWRKTFILQNTDKTKAKSLEKKLTEAR